MYEIARKRELAFKRKVVMTMTEERVCTIR